MFRWNGLAIIYRSEISFLAEFHPLPPPHHTQGGMRANRERAGLMSEPLHLHPSVLWFGHALFPYRFVRSKIYIPY